MAESPGDTSVLTEVAAQFGASLDASASVSASAPAASLCSLESGAGAGSDAARTPRRVSSASASLSASAPVPAPASSPPPAALPRAPQPSDFVLLRVIGRGAFGKVLQVAHRGSGRVYALKVYSKQFLAEHGQLEYTVTERTVMMRLTHPYIVSLRYAFQTADRLFLISDYCAGGELFLTLRKQGLMLEDAAKVYLGEIVLALEHMHSLGVLHRDLKPENILLDAQGHVKLTDYGLAKDFNPPPPPLSPRLPAAQSQHVLAPASSALPASADTADAAADAALVSAPTLPTDTDAGGAKCAPAPAPAFASDPSTALPPADADAASGADGGDPATAAGSADAPFAAAATGAATTAASAAAAEDALAASAPAAEAPAEETVAPAAELTPNPASD